MRHTTAKELAEELTTRCTIERAGFPECPNRIPCIYSRAAALIEAQAECVEALRALLLGLEDSCDPPTNEASGVAMRAGDAALSALSALERAP